MENGKVSIVIPVHNNAEYLDKCLASLAIQTYKNVEIILVDDASTDNSLSICKDFANQNGQVVVNPLETNVGAGYTRNAGLDLATGKYILFIDADDYIESDMVEKLVDAQEKYGSDLVVSSYRTFENENRIENRSFDFQNISDKFGVTKLFSDNFPDGFVGYLWNKLYLKDKLDDNHIRFTNMNRLEDAMFNIAYFSCISSCVVIPDLLYNYRKSTQLETIRKVPLNYVDLIELVYKAFVEYQESVGSDYYRRISQFYYSELGTYVENVFFKEKLPSFRNVRNLSNRVKDLDVPMYDNINLYRRILIWLLVHNRYIALYMFTFIKVRLKKKHSNVFFHIKDKLS